MLLVLVAVPLRTVTGEAVSDREDELEMVGESVLERVAFRSRVAIVSPENYSHNTTRRTTSLELWLILLLLLSILCCCSTSSRIAH